MKIQSSKKVEQEMSALYITTSAHHTQPTYSHFTQEYLAMNLPAQEALMRNVEVTKARCLYAARKATQR